MLQNKNALSRQRKTRQKAWQLTAAGLLAALCVILGGCAKKDERPVPGEEGKELPVSENTGNSGAGKKPDNSGSAGGNGITEMDSSGVINVGGGGLAVQVGEGPRAGQSPADPGSAKETETTERAHYFPETGAGMEGLEYFPEAGESAEGEESFPEAEESAEGEESFPEAGESMEESEYFLEIGENMEIAEYIEESDLAEEETEEAGFSKRADDASGTPAGETRPDRDAAATYDVLKQSGE